MELKEKIKHFPTTSGVYIFKDKEGKVLYIGKAKDLRKRVSSYFTRYLDSKTQTLISKTEDISYIPTSSCAQAQLLEASLIKENLPAYNIALKDDKSFPFICITAEDFPRVYICRKKKIKTPDRSFYFGPYTNVKLLRQALKVVRRIFGFRSCRKMPPRACLYGRIALCPCPCEGKIDSPRYKQIIENIVLFLNSHYSELIERLTAKMQYLAKQQKFEEAARVRDQIKALSLIIHPTSQTSEWEQLQDLKKILNLKKLPLRIEAFDISNLAGKEACGSLVSFYNGLPDKNNYRRFRIKTVEKIDDYGMLKEVVKRRYTRLLKERKDLPDLIIIDGGRGHLLAAKKQLEELNLDIPVIGIAKKKEDIYVEDNPRPIKFNLFHPGFKLIQRIRNEAHRFAFAYHQILRRKECLGR